MMIGSLGGHLTKIGLMVTFIAALLWHIALPAHAVTYEYKVAVEADKDWWDCPGRNTVVTAGVRTCFWSNGDWFHVSDEAQDGESAGVVWRNPASGRRGICRNSSGIGGTRFCNYDFPENTTIYYYAARCNGSRDDCRLVSSWVGDSDEIGRSTS